MRIIIHKPDFFVFALMILILGIDTYFIQELTAVSNCCEGEMGKCTGSAYCTACSTCNYCKYCNSGGSCGVCSDASNKSSTYSPRKIDLYPNSTSKNSSAYSNVYNMEDDIYSEYYLKTLMVNTSPLNLRRGPGINYLVLDRLNMYQELFFLAMKRDWVKVKDKSTGTVGFVHYKYVVVLTK